MNLGYNSDYCPQNIKLHLAMAQKSYLFYISQNYSYAILRPLQKAIVARGGKVAWFLEGNEVNSDYLLPDENRLMTISAVQTYQPEVVFLPGNFVPRFIPGLKVAVFHGFNSGKKNRRGFEDHFNIRGCFDLYCTQGPNTTQPFQALAQQYQHFVVEQTGWPALDPLFSPLDKQESEIKTVLMCSTFSRNLTCAPDLFETVKRLSQTGKWRWLIQFHPKMPSDIVEQYKSIKNEYLTFIETDNVIPILQQADIMLCDTSSVLIMFLMQAKPVVTFKNISPENYMVNIDQPDKLEEAIEYALSYPAELKEKIATFINETHPYIDGKSSERILTACDNLLSGENLPKKRKPLNFLRAFKMRKKLNYWRL